MHTVQRGQIQNSPEHSLTVYVWAGKKGLTSFNQHKQTAKATTPWPTGPENREWSVTHKNVFFFFDMPIIIEIGCIPSTEEEPFNPLWHSLCKVERSTRKAKYKLKIIWNTPCDTNLSKSRKQTERDHFHKSQCSHFYLGHLLKICSEEIIAGYGDTTARNYYFLLFNT